MSSLLLLIFPYLAFGNSVLLYNILLIFFGGAEIVLDILMTNVPLYLFISKWQIIDDFKQADNAGRKFLFLVNVLHSFVADI